VDDPSLGAVTATELSRLRRGFPVWMTFGLPFVLVLPLGVIAALSPEGQQGAVWDAWLQIVLMFWGVLLPMSAALYAGVSVRQDEQARRLLYSYAFPRGRLLVGKYAALAMVWLLSAVLLCASLLLVALLLGEGGDVLTVVVGCLAPWLAGLGALALCLVVAHAWGFTATMCTGVAGMMFGALLADKVVWWVIPLAWPMRVVVPTAGIEASGVPLPEGHPLHDMGVLPIAFLLSVTLAAVLLAVGSRYVNRREL
jgi:ABC-2 type transport system permease protein